MQAQAIDMASTSAYIAPAVARPQWLPVPPSGAATEEREWVLDSNSLTHLEDPTGEGRRLFEGWASLKGIDYQGHEIAPDAFEKMAHEYLAKNPVLLWDHIRHLPIGTVHRLTTTEEGLYIQGEIWRLNDLTWDEEEEARKAEERGEVYAGQESIAQKCNEVWHLIRTGRIRGLSIRGKARQFVAAYSPELGEYIPRVTEVLLYEISVTPTQVHPGAKIVAVNTLAKSLDLLKGLPLYRPTEPTTEPSPGPKQAPQEQKTGYARTNKAKAIMRLPTPPTSQQGEHMSFEKIRELQRQLGEELEAMGSAGDAIEIPEDVAVGFKQFGDAVQLDGVDLEKGLDPNEAAPPENPPQNDPPVGNQNNTPQPGAVDMEALANLMGSQLEKALSPINQRLEALEDNAPSNRPEKPRSMIRVPTANQRPEGARPKPTGAQGHDGIAAVEKALDILASSRDGHADMGKGEYHGCTLTDAAQLTMVHGAMTGHFRPESLQVRLSPQAQSLLDSCMGG